MTESERPQISAIIPSYNHAHYVAEAIDSVLAQDIEIPYEVVVIDDGSSDGTREILERYRDRPNVRLDLRENHGISSTFNRGLELARGEYVAYCCSDDRWHPGHLRGAWESLQGETKAIASFGLARIVDEKGAEVPGGSMFRTVNASNPLEELLRLGNCLCFVAAFFRREDALAVGGFDPAVQVLQDYDLWLRLLERGKAVQRTEPSVDFRWDGANASGSSAAVKKREDLIRVLSVALERTPLLREDLRLRARVQKRLASAHIRLARRLEDPNRRREHLRAARALGAPWLDVALEVLKGAFR